MLYKNVNIRVTRQEKKIRKLKSMWQQPKENQNKNFEGFLFYFFYFIFLSSLIPFFMILSNQITKRNKVSLAENFQRKGKKLLYHSSKDFILNILHMYQNFNPKAKTIEYFINSKWYVRSKSKIAILEKISFCSIQNIF